MILSDRDIKKAIADKRIKITPKPDYETQLGSCSIDLHLGNKFRVFRNSSYPYIDLKNPIEMSKIMDERIVKKISHLLCSQGTLP